MTIQVRELFLSTCLMYVHTVCYYANCSNFPKVTQIEQQKFYFSPPSKHIYHCFNHVKGKLVLSIYRIAGKFGGGKFGEFGK